MESFEKAAASEVVPYEPDIDKYLQARKELSDLLGEAGNRAADSAAQARIEQLEKEVRDRALSANAVKQQFSPEQ